MKFVSRLEISSVKFFIATKFRRKVYSVNNPKYLFNHWGSAENCIFCLLFCEITFVLLTFCLFAPTHSSFYFCVYNTYRGIKKVSVSKVDGLCKTPQNCVLTTQAGHFLKMTFSYLYNTQVIMKIFKFWNLT